MPSFKVAYGLRDGHVTHGERSHAELIGPDRRYDDYVRAIAFPDKRAIYFRFYAPRYDGMGRPTAEETDAAFEAADKAFKAFVRCGVAAESWKTIYWDHGRAHILGLQI